MWRRIAVSIGWGCAGLVGALVLGVPLWIQTHRADLPDAGDADLMASGFVPARPDGFDLLREAAQRIEGLDDDESRAWLTAVRMGDVAWDADRVAELVERNRPALAVLERAITTPGRIPQESQIGIVDDDVMQVLVEVPLLVRVAALEAEMLSRRGMFDEAFERAQAGLRVGQALSRFTDINLVVMMTGVSCQGIGLAQLEELVGAAPLTTSGARALAARIESLRIPRETWPAVWAGEYRIAKNLTRASLEADPSAASEGLPLWLRWVPEDYLFQPNRTQSKLAARMRERQERSVLNCQDALAEGPEPAPRVVRMLRIFASPNPVGGFLDEIAMPSFERFDVRRCHNDAKLGLVQLAIALRAHQSATGALPDRLEQLVPTYLEAIPIDAFDGAPLRYAKDRGVVYSIGDDLADAGGLDATDLGQTAEPSIRIEL
jgi:hypothetical protein